MVLSDAHVPENAQPGVPQHGGARNHAISLATRTVQRVLTTILLLAVFIISARG